MTTLFEMPGVEDRIREAKAIVHAIGTHNELAISVSGGKDSIVLDWLVTQAGFPPDVAERVYCNTGNECPDVIKFVRQEYPYVTMIRPEFSWFYSLVKRGLPTYHRRWCCAVQKEKPLRAYCGDRVTLTGIRHEESFKRSKRRIIEQTRGKCAGQLIVHPIIHLTEADVWHIIEANGLPCPAIYDEPGFSRVGCVVCPMRRMRQHAIWRRRYPRHYEVFEKFAARVFEKWNWDELEFPDVEALLKWWYKGSVGKRDLSTPLFDTPDEALPEKEPDDE